MDVRYQDRSVGELLRQLADDVVRLIRDEMALAKNEAGEKMNRVMMALVSIVAGSLMGFAALIVLLFALVEGLSKFMPAWLAAVIVGGAVAIVGFVLVRSGATALSADKLVPDRTVRNVQRDVQMVKEQVT